MNSAPDIDIDAVKGVLTKELEQIERLDQSSAEGRKTVKLDQTSVGRLSRMDALQQQALAQETQRRRVQRRKRIEETLNRIDQEDFGYCEKCGEPISRMRLELDWTVRTCVRCAG
jgi:DnaK suppressor protein